MTTQNLKRKKNNNLKDQKRTRPSKVSTIIRPLSAKQMGKRAEEALQEIEERFRLAFENANIGMCLVDLQGRLAKVNHQMCEILGYSQEELERMTINDIAHPEDLNISPTFIKRATSGEIEHTNFEKRYFHKEGHIVWGAVSSSLVRDPQGVPQYFISHVQDITQRKKAEEALRSEHDKFRGMLSALGDGVDIINKNNIIEFQNELLRERNGDKIGEKCYAAYMGLEEPCHFCPIQEAIKTGTATRVELVGKDGRNYELNSSPFTDVDGEVKVIELVRDITERKQAEEALQKSEERYRSLVENAKDVIFTVSRDGIVTSLNPAFETVTGWSRGEWIGKPFMPIIHPDDVPLAMSLFQRILHEKVSLTHELRVLTQSGEYRVGEFEGTPKIETNSVVSCLGIVRDITERKRAEEVLRQESTFRTSIIEHATEGLCVCHETIEFPHVAFTVWNDRMTEITGYSMEEINRLGWYQTMYPDPEVQAQVIERMARMRQGDNLLGEGWEITRADGEKRLLSISTSVLQTGDGIAHVLGLMHDITEHKQADEMLRQSEEKYRTILENITDGYFEVDIAGNFTFLNDSLCQLLGYSKYELMGMNNRQYTDQENSKKLYQAFNRVFRTGEPTKEFDWAVIRKDGTKRYIEASVSLVKNPSDEPIGFRGIVRDITERKQAEEALRKSEEKYRLVSENIPVAVYSALPDEHSTNLFISGKMEELTGYPGHQLIEDPELWMKVIHPEDRERVWRKIEKHRRERKPLDIEYRLITRDNITKWIKDKAIPALNEKGEIIRIDGFMEDITEYKRAEAALQQSEERYRTLVEESFDGIFFQKGFNIIFANRRLHEMLGYKEGELEGLDHWLVYHPDYQALTRERAQARMRGEAAPSTYEVKFLRKDGSSFWGEINAKVINVFGEPGIQVWAKDISEHKQVEEILHAERERFRSLSENAPFGMAMIDQEGAFKYINPKFKELFGYDLNDVPDGKTWFRKAYPDPDYRHQVISTWLNDLASSKSGKKRPRAFTAKCKDGSEKIINFIPVQFDSGENLLACEDITERQRAEEALRESEERYRTILENIEDGYFEVDLPGNFTFFNDSLCRILGYSKEEMIGMGNQQYTDEENRKKLFKAFNKVYNTGKSIKGFDWKVFRKDGTKLFGEVSVSLVKDSKGQPIGFRGIARDITDRKQAEETLLESKANLVGVLESTADGILAIDNQGKAITSNSRFAQLWRIPQELLERGDDDALLAFVLDQLLDPEAFLARVQALYDSDKEDNDVILFKDGRVFERYSRPLASESRMMGRVWSFRDITEHKQAEEALRRSEESSKKLAQENAIMAEIGRIISSTLNIDEVYERFNEEVNKLISFDRISVATINPKSPTVTIAYAWGNKIDGRIQGDVFPIENTTYSKLVANRSGILIQIESEDELKAYPHLLNTFRAGFRSTISVPLISKNEVIGGLNFRSLIPNNYTEIDLNLAEKVGHQIAGAIANAQLFKELMQAEEDKIAIQEQFRQSQKMEAIGGLAGGIAHDFNNLLTVIKGYAELSCLGLDTSDPLRGNIEEILKASERATNLTRQLLAFSRRQILDFKVINLNTLLKDLDKMLHRILGEDIDLTYHLSETIGKVKTDPGQIEQVILNLAVNARDAMPSGGKLTIETLNMELSEAYAQTHMEVTPGHYVMLSVSDSGAGMTPEVRERIFEPFFTTKEKGKGTGLGLSTVYGIVKQSGGNIIVYSEPGLGTTFKIYLSRVEEEENHLQRKDLDISLSTGNETILLTEDEQSVRELAARILRDRGYQVYEAPDGREALAIAQRHPERKIHLLLTDVVMPGMSGKELADRLKLSIPDIKVLFISGYTDNAIVHHGVLDKGVNFIQKPFTPESLARKLREVLDR